MRRARGRGHSLLAPDGSGRGDVPQGFSHRPRPRNAFRRSAGDPEPLRRSGGPPRVRPRRRDAARSGARLPRRNRGQGVAPVRDGSGETARRPACRGRDGAAVRARAPVARRHLRPRGEAVKKAWIVARHEFAVTVKRVWFVFATLVPILMTAAAISAQVFAVRSVEETQQALRERKIGVVDLWGGLAPRDGAAFFKDESEATRALSTGEIGSYLVVPGDYLTNDHAVIDVKTMRRPTLLTADHLPIPAWIRDWLLESVLKGEDPGRIARAKHPFPHRPTYLDASGKPTGENADEAKIRSIAACFFFFLLFTSIFTSSSYLLQGMAEEKEHRVMEMVISSVTPDQLMVGKLVGLGAAGLVQMAVWVGTGAIAPGTGASGL